MSAVMGLDLSTTSTGVCVDGETRHWSPPGDDRWRRCRQISMVIGEEIDDAEPDLIVIEAIGTRHVQTAIAASEIHTLVRIHTEGWRTLMVAPTLVKRFATGMGNVGKDAMMLAAVTAGWQHRPDSTNDEADAWWLWALGCATFDVWEVDATQYRRDVLAKLGAAQ